MYTLSLMLAAAAAVQAAEVMGGGAGGDSLVVRRALAGGNGMSSSPAVVVAEIPAWGAWDEGVHAGDAGMLSAGQKSSTQTYVSIRTLLTSTPLPALPCGPMILTHAFTSGCRGQGGNDARRADGTRCPAGGGSRGCRGIETPAPAPATSDPAGSGLFVDVVGGRSPGGGHGDRHDRPGLHSGRVVRGETESGVFPFVCLLLPSPWPAKYRESCLDVRRRRRTLTPNPCPCPTPWPNPLFSSSANHHYCRPKKRKKQKSTASLLQHPRHVPGDNLNPKLVYPCKLRRAGGG
jgi:hypothetical protein